MRVRWTTDAADDLERICDYIAESRLNPRDEWRSPWSSASGRWKRSRTWGALVASRAHERSPSLRSRSLQSTKFAKNRSSFCESCTERSDGLDEDDIDRR